MLLLFRFSNQIFVAFDQKPIQCSVESGREAVPFFNTFYTVLIFSDVLIVLISLRYSTTYHVVFRNSGFAVATVMIRLALAGPRYLGTALGGGAALYNVGVAAAYNYVAPAAQESLEQTKARWRSDPAETEGAEE